MNLPKFIGFQTIAASFLFLEKKKEIIIETLNSLKVYNYNPKWQTINNSRQLDVHFWIDDWKENKGKVIIEINLISIWKLTYIIQEYNYYNIKYNN